MGQTGTAPLATEMPGATANRRRAGWANVRPLLRSVLESPWRAPASFTLLVILTATTIALLGMDGRDARHVLHRHSSNLKHLLDLDFHTIIVSAFWLDDAALLGQWAVLFVAVLVPAERWLGTRLWLMVFGAGHIGATAITLSGIWVAIRTGAASDGLARTVDVGVSYGFFAVLAVMVYRLPFALRFPAAAVLLVFLAALFVVGGDFTDGGHLAAGCIGFSLYPLVRGRMGKVPVPGGQLPVASHP